MVRFVGFRLLALARLHTAGRGLCRPRLAGAGIASALRARPCLSGPCARWLFPGAPGLSLDLVAGRRRLVGHAAGLQPVPILAADDLRLGSGISLGVNALPAGHRRIGVVGLGTGTLTALGHAGDYFRIYEINPQVRELAWNRFSYLKHLTNSGAKVDVVMGDARLSMEREAPQQLDLLALDAFSSDSIPLHLLTREAFALYQRHLKTNGVVVVHISNHYLDLEPVVVNLARQFHYQASLVDFNENDEDWWIYSSTWMILTCDQRVIDAPGIAEGVSAITAKHPKIPLWTDDFASLFPILR